MLNSSHREVISVIRRSFNSEFVVVSNFIRNDKILTSKFLSVFLYKTKSPRPIKSNHLKCQVYSTLHASLFFPKNVRMAYKKTYPWIEKHDWTKGCRQDLFGNDSLPRCASTFFCISPKQIGSVENYNGVPPQMYNFNTYAGNTKYIKIPGLFILS